MNASVTIGYKDGGPELIKLGTASEALQAFKIVRGNGGDGFKRIEVIGHNGLERRQSFNPKAASKPKAAPKSKAPKATKDD